MASLSNKIREYAKANGVSKVDFLEDVMLQDDSNGQGVYIKEWNLDIAKPTIAQLDALDAQADFNVAIINLRAKRNKDLQDSDWTQLPDNTLTSEQRNAWMQFRTELRNITNGLNTVEQVKNVDYPDKP
jgi:hypothetical protein